MSTKEKSDSLKIPEFNWNEKKNDIMEITNNEDLDNDGDNQPIHPHEVIIIESSDEDIINDINQICTIEVGGVVSSLEIEMDQKRKMKLNERRKRNERRMAKKKAKESRRRKLNEKKKASKKAEEAKRRGQFQKEILVSLGLDCMDNNYKCDYTKYQSLVNQFYAKC